MPEDKLSGLKHMGASWFVSFLYFDMLDDTHFNWQAAGSLQMRLGYYTKGRKNYVTWLEHILAMKPVYLNRNNIGLTAEEIKAMARELLDFLEKQNAQAADQTQKEQ